MASRERHGVSTWHIYSLKVADGARKTRQQDRELQEIFPETEDPIL